MLDNYDVLQYEKPVADAYAEVTRLLMENIAKHLSSDGDMYAAMWETQKLKEMGMLTRENARIINKYLKDVPRDVTNGMKGAAQDAYDQLKSMASVAERMAEDPREPDEIVKDTIDYWRGQALDKMNLTNTTMLESGQQAYLRAINDVMRLTVDAMSDSQKQNTMNALNTSAYGVISGGLTFDKAKEYAINQMMDDGVYGFVDRAGRHWSPEAYASMVVRTTVHNVSVEATKQMSIDFGVDVFQCSWHAACRPSHYDYEGNFYSWSGEAGTFIDGNGEEHAYVSVDEADYGDAAGLFGVNCNHQPLPMDEGVSVPFSKDEIPSREENDAAYAESQEQRALERSIRDAKTKIDVYKAAGNDAKVKEWQAKLKDRDAKMQSFVTATGRRRDIEREKVYTDGARQIVSNAVGELGFKFEKELGPRVLLEKYYPNSLSGLEARLNSYGIVMDKSVRRLNGEAVARVSAGVFRVFEDYPSAYGVLKEVGTRTAEPGETPLVSVSRGRLKFVIDAFGKEDSGVKLFSIMRNGSSDEYTAAYRQPRYYAKNGSIESIGYHEAGHLLTWAYAQKIAGNRPVTDADYDAATDMIINRAFDILRSHGESRTLDELRLEVSGRATVDLYETIAESVADKYNNRGMEKPLTNAIIQSLEEGLKND